MQKFQRFLADQRWDLPHYTGMKKFIEEEFQAYAKQFISPSPRVVKNWLIESAGGIKVRVNQSVDSTLFATARVGKEDFLRHLTTDDVLELDLSDNAVNYVEVQIFDKTCQDDTVAIWDTSAGAEGEEFSQNVDLVFAQDFVLVSNIVAFSGDADKLPLAEVTTSGGVITLITDSREFLFGADPFNFGSPRSDKGIGSIKDMYDGITTILQEMKGTSAWYTEGVSALGLLERFSYNLVDGGDIEWENPTANELKWSAALKIIAPNRAFDYTVSAQAISILSDEVAYVTLPDVGVAPGGALPVSVVANASYLLDETNTRNYILGYRSATGKLYFGNGWNGVELESGEKTQLGDGITDAFLIATGLTDENDPTPPYTSTNIITAGASFTQTISELDAEVERPLRIYATEPTEDSNLNFTPHQVKRSDGTGRSVASVLGSVPSFVASSIDFQAQTTAGGTFNITFPASTVGQFRRCAFTLTSTGTLEAVFSAEAASVAALANPGTLFVLGDHVGWIDLEATDVAGKFKTAGSATDIIENEVGGISRVVVAPKAADTVGKGITGLGVDDDVIFDDADNSISFDADGGVANMLLEAGSLKTTAGVAIDHNRPAYDRYQWEQSPGIGLNLKHVPSGRSEIYFPGGGSALIGMGTTVPLDDFHLSRAANAALAFRMTSSLGTLRQSLETAAPFGLVGVMLNLDDLSGGVNLRFGNSAPMIRPIGAVGLSIRKTTGNDAGIVTSETGTGIPFSVVAGTITFNRTVAGTGKDVQNVASIAGAGFSAAVVAGWPGTDDWAGFPFIRITFTNAFAATPYTICQVGGTGAAQQGAEIVVLGSAVGTVDIGVDGFNVNAAQYSLHFITTGSRGS